MRKFIRQLIQKGQVTEAHEQAVALLKHRPHQLSSWMAWGDCELAQGKSVWARIEECQERRRAFPRLHAPIFYLAMLQQSRKAAGECVRLLQPIAHEQPSALLSHPSVVKSFADACFELNDLPPLWRLYEADVALNPSALNPALWRANPAWWKPQEGRLLAMRRTNPSDALWLKQVFSEPLFAQQVNRGYANKVARVAVSTITRELERQNCQSPSDIGALMLVVEDRQDRRPIGLACFVSIDAMARQSELVVGFTEEQSSPRIAELSCLLVRLAFEQLRLRRVTTSIYSSNPKTAQLKSTLRKFGFQEEGVLRSHAFLGNNQFSDVHILGGLQSEVETSFGFRRHMRRMTAAPIKCA